MNGNEFLKKLKKLAKAKGVDSFLVTSHGKGSHGTVYFGKRFTTIKDRKKEIGVGLLKSMLKDLGIEISEL